jgi:hypothetical protein
MEHEPDKKGKPIMIRKIFLILIMGLLLAGAAITSTPLPVLLAMGGLVIFALVIAIGSEQQRME